MSLLSTAGSLGLKHDEWKKIYVAGSWVDRKHVKKVMIELEKAGFIITEDWTSQGDDEDSKKYCDADVAGVKNCNVLILVNSSRKSPGKYWECGMAHAWGKPIISVGKEVPTIFKYLVKKHFIAKISKTMTVASTLIQFLDDNEKNDLFR
jgi:nucleoside 2-deoxyribosyltransferase